MAILVEHVESTEQFIILGAGFGMFKTSRPGRFGGQLFPAQHEGSASLVAVCDANGAIRWFESEELSVIEVDGEALAEVIPPVSDPVENEPTLSDCPACSTALGAKATHCPSCGLRVTNN